MEIARFSPSSEYVASSGPDGRLRIYETATSKFLQEFEPGLNTAAVCTCLEWAPISRKEVQAGRKKRKKSATLDRDVIAVGTSIGSIYLYNVIKAELESKSKEEHSGKITGLSWCPSSTRLYSCGEDGFLAEWDPVQGTVLSRWKASKTGLYTCRMFKDNLLAAGKQITLWDLKSKTLLQTFVGHPSPVKQLEIITSSNSAADDYFISMGEREKYLKIWCPSERNAVANLAVSENPSYFHAACLNETSEVVISATTPRGILYMFRHKLNGPLKKALMPSYSLKVMDSSDSNKIVPILISCLTAQSSMLCLYGNSARYQFEKFDVNSFDAETVVTRQFSLPSRSNLSKKSRQTQDSDIVEVPNTVKHLQPGADPLPSSSDPSTKKRKKDEDDKTLDDGELPMEERLTNLTIENPTEGIRSNNLAHLLSQGLHSKDGRILQSVLARWDEDVVMNTVRSLPVQQIVPLLNEVKVILSQKGQLNHSNLVWLKAILKVHSPYLMSCPHVEDLLTPFMSLLHTRQVLYPQMCQLRGKLELIRGHIEAKQHPSEPQTDALLKYDDDSPVEDYDDDAMLLSESEDFLTEDDLGVEDSEEEDDEKSGSSANSDSDAEFEKVASDDEQEATPTTKTNSKTKIKGTIVDDDSELESMDED